MNSTLRAVSFLWLTSIAACAAPGDEASPSGSSRPDRGSDYRGPEPQSAESARAVYGKGLTFAREGQYAIAAQHFGEAWKTTPASPETVFNLGLAQAKAGRELLGICWLEAYLALLPDAPNASAIRTEIDRLEREVLTKGSKIVEGAVQSVDKLDKDEDRKRAWSSLGRSRAYIGDVEGGADLWKRATWIVVGPKEEQCAIVLRKEYLERLCSHGVVDPILTALRKQDTIAPADRKVLLSKCGEKLAEQGRVKEANEFAAELAGADKDRVLVAIANHYGRKGEDVAVDEILSGVSGDEGDWTLSRRIQELFRKGDLAAARKVIDRLHSVSARGVQMGELGIQLLRRGKAEEAREMARSILALPLSRINQWDRARPQILSALLLGNLDVALGQLKTLGVRSYGLTNDLEYQHHYYGKAILVLGLRGDWDGAARTMAAFEKLPIADEDQEYQPYRPGWHHWGACLAHAWKGEIRPALESYKKVKPRIQAEILLDVVEAFLDAGDPVAAEQLVWIWDDQTYAASPVTLGGKNAEIFHAPIQMEALLRIADRVGKDSPERSRRLLVAAVRVAQARHVLPYSGDLLERLAGAQDRLGDAVAAQETRALRIPPSAGTWMGKAQRLQEWWFPIATNLEKAMRDDMEGKKPAEIPGAVGSVGAQLVEQLYEIRGVRAGLSAKGQ